MVVSKDIGIFGHVYTREKKLDRLIDIFFRLKHCQLRKNVRNFTYDVITNHSLCRMNFSFPSKGYIARRVLSKSKQYARLNVPEFIFLYGKLLRASKVC